MNSEEQICQEALRLLRELRTDYLTRACEGDEEFRARVEEMLRAVAERTAGEDPPEVTLEESGPVTEGPGSVIGHYKLLQPIGEGGFGVVYMAEQTAPVVRRVALKIIKLGMDTKQVIARFEAERQALALMDHPNIAKVFDAGSTATGRPYFVMELVRGIPITEFCDKNRLSARQRLELVIPVCDAIQHAHHKGIIHRDIKPSNILVTLHDGAPLPMVIDFGIAKATNQRLTEKTLFTDFAQMIGTPAYMSPEQAEMSKLDVDTRTDVYSLGVLLYELLTGTTPFSSRELLDGGYGAMQRIIAEQEPPRPSTRLSTMADEQKTTVARNRGNDLSDLGARLRGDLDWIVMKCLEKERGRRYETASALAADLQRHLQSEPVLARPPSLTYRLQKAVRRNRLAFTATGAVALALVLGLAAASWQAVQARREAQRAQQAEALAGQRLAESEAVAKFMTEVFQSPDPARDGRMVTVVEALAAVATKLDTDLAGQPAVRARLQEALSSTYAALGFFGEAVPLQEAVVDYHRMQSGQEHPYTLDTMSRLAVRYADARREDDAIRLAEELLDRRRELLGLEHPETLSEMHNLANFYAMADHRDGVSPRKRVIELREEVLKLRRKVNGELHRDTLMAMVTLARSYGEAGRPVDALRLCEELLPLSRKVIGPEHPDTFSVMLNVVSAYRAAGRGPEALRLMEESFRRMREVLGPEHPNALSVMHNLALYYNAHGRLEEALQLQEEVLPLRRKTAGPEHPDTLRAMNNLAISYAFAGRRDEALQLWEELLPLRRKALGSEHPHTLGTMDELSDAYVTHGRFGDALKLREELLSLRRNALGADHPQTFQAMNKLAIAYAAAGTQIQADKLVDQLRTLRKTQLATDLSVVPRAAPASPERLDLTEAFNAGLDADWHNFDDFGNNLASLPRGLQTFGGVTFEVRAIVQLSSTNLAALQPEYPEQVTGIRVMQQAASLHFLHGTGWPLHDDNGTNVITEIGRYLVHYTDGQTAEIPIRYGEHVRNWQFWPEGEAREHGGATPVWKGPQARWEALWPNTGVRLYHTSWENPRPDTVISSIDFISTMTGSAPFLLAITVQPPVLAAVTPSQ